MTTETTYNKPALWKAYSVYVKDDEADDFYTYKFGLNRGIKGSMHGIVTKCLQTSFEDDRPTIYTLAFIVEHYGPDGHLETFNLEANSVEIGKFEVYGIGEKR